MVTRYINKKLTLPDNYMYIASEITYSMYELILRDGITT